MGGYFFAIASRYPVATTRKTIASTSVIPTHPLSGERYRRRIAPAQDVSGTVYQTTHKRANNDITVSRTGYNQKTGEKYSIATDTKGLTIKLTKSKEGVEELTLTQVPNIDTKEKHDNVIKEMADQSKTQVESHKRLGAPNQQYQTC